MTGLVSARNPIVARVLEGCILAVSRQSKSVDITNNSVPGAPGRVSFAKLREPLEVPGLLDVQTDSFEWLIGSDRWREKALERGEPTHELRLTGECGFRVLLAERGQEESALTSVSGDANEAQFGHTCE